MAPLVGLCAFAATACGRSTQHSAAAPSASDTAPAAEAAIAVEPMDEREAAQWEAARGDDPEERMRLADRVGCAGLRERAGSPALLLTALRAAQYCTDFSELPWLAEVGAGGGEADSLAALDAIVKLSARPVRAVDPEDGADLRKGCTALLALARAADRPKERRVLAIRALRMLAERHCVRAEDIPTDLTPR